MDRKMPGIVVAALRGGAGKTIFSVGIIAALCRKGMQAAPFKKGPDYIDAGWLALAAGRPCYNLDTFLIDSQTIIQSFDTQARDADIAVIEGNRGLYDCIDTGGETSTAELAKLLDLPLILCIDGTKTTRTMAAVVAGCVQFDPDVKLKGVVLNRVAGPRHERILRNSIEYHCGIPVLGSVPRQRQQRFPERHMGLVPTFEHKWAHEAKQFIQELAEKYIDLAAVVDVARGTYRWTETDHKPKVGADNLFNTKCQATVDGPADEQLQAAVISQDASEPDVAPEVRIDGKTKPRIGILRDSAFQFYYPENLNALQVAGAELVYTSPLSETDLPSVDALYIGGGFPETHAVQLSQNRSYAQQIQSLASAGLPIYAECGGLIYLGKALALLEGTFAMTGVLPIVFGFSKRPQGHGYTIARVDRENPYFAPGTILRGHEFHYSTVETCEGADTQMVFEMQRGNGISQNRDGFCHRNVLATYTHIHALGTPQWAPALVEKARSFHQLQAVS
jgi:cobyrinic acid a,c-diamide synthase